MRLLLGISGSIAAYKTPELIRRLVKGGIHCTTVLTSHAEAFVTPLSLGAVSDGGEVFTQDSAFSRHNVAHLNLARNKDLLLIAPASANLIAKLAHGLADNLLTSTCLAFVGPKIIVPAMHQEMWDNPATQSNIALLKSYGYYILGPEIGDLACGDVGVGRMADLDLIVLCCLAHQFPWLNLQGKRILVTAGGTQEPLDSVRILSNRSTGKMGQALATLAGIYGAEVHLVSTTPTLPAPVISKQTLATTAGDLHLSLQDLFPTCDYLFMAAAVSDFTPNFSPSKINRHDHLTLNLTGTIDILTDLSKQKTHQKMIGFCLSDDENLEHVAKEKLLRKNIDIIIANSPQNIGQELRDYTIIDRLGRQSKLIQKSILAHAHHILKFSCDVDKDDTHYAKD